MGTTGPTKQKQTSAFNYFMRQIRIMKIQMAELEQRLKREQEPAAFAAYQEAVAAKVEQDADTSNVVRLRGHRSP